MLIGIDDTTENITTLGTFFFFNVCLHLHSFPLRADRWKSDNPVHGSHREILGGIQIPSPSSSSPATRVSW